MKSNIETQVMASVATIYTARMLISATAFKLYAAVTALYGLGQLVWVSRVFENLGRVGIEHAGTFALSALMNTDFYVQATLLVLVVAGLSLARDIMARPPSSSARLAL
jgi:uncharacterized membrane protein YqhA